MALQEEPGSWSCYNGILDADESDWDCGGSCSTKCRYNQKCNSNEDCDAEYSCVENVCASTCGSQKRVLTSSKADTPDIRDHARFNRLCNGDNRQCALRGEEGSGEGVPRGKLWCVRCLDQTGHSILLQAKHSLVAILTHYTRYAPPTPLNWGRTYSRMRLSSALRPRTIRPCTAHDTQYCCLMYSLGRVYSRPSAPTRKSNARRQRRREYLSAKKRPRCFSPGNASRPYPMRSFPVSPASTLPTQRPQWVQRTGFT